MKITKENLEQIIKEEIEAVLEKKDLTEIQVTKLPSGKYRFFDRKSKLQGLYTKDGEYKSGDLRLLKNKAEDLIKELTENKTVLDEEERLSEQQVAAKINASRDLCRRLRDLGWSVEWDQTKSMRQQDTPDERAKSCECANRDKYNNIIYFDPKDPLAKDGPDAIKKSCLSRN